MSRFEELYKSKKTSVSQSEIITLEEIDKLRGGQEFPGNPIAKLEEEEFQKLRWAATKSKHFVLDFKEDPADRSKRHVKITFGNMELFSDQSKTNVTEEEFTKVASFVHDLAVADDLKQYETTPTKFFQNNNFAPDLFADIKDAAADYTKKLSENNWTRYGRSSDNYRLMQDSIKSLNDKLATFDALDLRHPEKLRELRKELTGVFNSIDNYIAGKGGIYAKGKKGYERNRIDAARDAYFKFLKLARAVGAADMSLSTEARLTNVKFDVTNKYTDLKRTSTGLQEYLNSAENSAQRIADIFGGYEHELSAAERTEVRDCFEKMCEFKLRNALTKSHNLNKRDLATTLTSEEIKENIRSTNEYQRLFGDLSKVNATTAKIILTENSELKAMDNARDFINRKVGINPNELTVTRPIN